MTGKGIFISGTDTGIGKTITAACLAASLSKKGFKVAVYKPVQTGCFKKEGRLVSPDLELIREYSGLDDKDLFNSYCHEKESSPHLAAESAEEDIDIGVIKDKFNSLVSLYDYVIVEGAGGLIVPLKRDYLVIDLIKELKIPVIIVARAGLGTINHTSLSIRCLKQNDIELIGVILNFYKNVLIEEDNKRVIKELNDAAVLGVIPYYDKIAKDKLLDDFEKNINMKNI